MRIIGEILAVMIALAIRHWKVLARGIAGLVYMVVALEVLSSVSGRAVPYAPFLIVASILFFIGVLR